MLAFAVAALALAGALLATLVALFARGSRRWEARARHALGHVVGASAIAYGGHHVPLVEYVVDGVAYRVAGPTFESATVYPGARCNLTTREELPRTLTARPLSHDVIDASYAVSTESRYEQSVVAALYPIGCEADVWYDPLRPSRAYVERPVRRYHVAKLVIGGWALAALALGAALLALWAAGAR